VKCDSYNAACDIATDIANVGVNHPKVQRIKELLHLDTSFEKQEPSYVEFFTGVACTDY